MWPEGKYRHVYPRERDSWRNASYLKEEFVPGCDTERDKEKRDMKEGDRDKERERWGANSMLWYLGSVSGWAPVCGRAAWILSWCLSCTPAPSRCKENNTHTFLKALIYAWRTETATTRVRELPRWPVAVIWSRASELQTQAHISVPTTQSRSLFDLC